MVVPSPLSLATVIANTVAVCIYDRPRQRAGLAHFQYPLTTNPHEATARYGNVAIRHLLRLITKRPEHHQQLIAHVIGGAENDNPACNDLAQANVKLATKLLKKLQIPLGSRDVGGTQGRKIVMDSSTGHVAILKVDQLRSADWVQPDSRVV